MRKNMSGFTIVELLVVIVTISILSTITVVAYSNIQNRAKNTLTTTAVSRYLTALKLYASKNGVINNMMSQTICLGEDSDYPAKAPNELGQCGVITGAPTRTNPAMAAPLLKYLDGRFPEFSLAEVNYEGRRGIALATFAWGGGQLRYVLHGNADCLPGFVKGGGSGNEGTSCFASLNPDGTVAG